MMNYKRLNTIIGWMVFAIAAVTYCMTIEPTASFWDCPEFIIPLIGLLKVSKVKF